MGVIWEGGYFRNSVPTVKLSEPISVESGGTEISIGIDEDLIIETNKDSVVEDEILNLE